MSLSQRKRGCFIYTPTLFVLFAPLLSIAKPGPFVTVQNTLFFERQRPLSLVSINFWHALFLADAQHLPQLRKELDQLKSIGFNHLRVMAAFEGPDTEPWRMIPSTQPSPGKWQSALLENLDRLMVEAKSRNLYITLTLSNFWPWSGGFAQYLKWAKPEVFPSIPYPPPAEEGNWNTYQDFTSQFYETPEAISLYRDTLQKIILRTNQVSQVPYREDPTLLAWQLANEPRTTRDRKHFLKWIQSTSEFIHQLDPNHLISLGSEGETQNPKQAGLNPFEDHSFPYIHFVTAHLWVQNWEIYNPLQHEKTFHNAITFADQYLDRHIEVAKKLKKPFVLEEFGLARDQGHFDPYSPTRARNEYLNHLFQRFTSSQKSKSHPFQGIGLWAWSGHSIPRRPGQTWVPNDPPLGDPPHEAQGWYGIYSHDLETLKVIKNFSLK
jgi:mannan endo-1,4-beta-mannosidase